MSFTADVKTELTETELLTDAQKKAYAYGFLIFGKSFNQRSVSCASDYKCVIDSFCDAITELTGIVPTVSGLKSGKTVLKIASAADRKKLINFFDHSLNEIALSSSGCPKRPFEILKNFVVIVGAGLFHHMRP